MADINKQAKLDAQKPANNCSMYFTPHPLNTNMTYNKCNAFCPSHHDHNCMPM